MAPHTRRVPPLRLFSGPRNFLRSALAVASCTRPTRSSRDRHTPRLPLSRNPLGIHRHRRTLARRNQSDFPPTTRHRLSVGALNELKPWRHPEGPRLHQRAEVSHLERQLTTLPTLPASFAHPQSAPGDTRCDPPRAAPPARSSAHLPTESSQTNPTSDSPPALPWPSSPRETFSRSHPTPPHSPERPPSANTLPATWEKHASHRG